MKNLFDIIDKKQQEHIFTKNMNDKDLETLAMYIVNKQPKAIINNLIIPEGGITGTGIAKVVEILNKASYTLKRLDISDNGLSDEDVNPLLDLGGLEELIVRDNSVTEKLIKDFENKGIRVESDFSDNDNKENISQNISTEIPILTQFNKSKEINIYDIKEVSYISYIIKINENEKDDFENVLGKYINNIVEEKPVIPSSHISMSNK